MIKVELYAILADFFPRELEVPVRLYNIRELKSYLGDLQQEARELLSICRFAVNEVFVAEDYILRNNDVVLVIPPSSGG